MFPSRSPSGSASGLLLALLLLLPAGASAQRRTYIEPSVVVRQQYDSNVLSRPDPESSQVTRAGAKIVAERTSEFGHIRLETSLAARRVWEFTDLDTVDPTATYDTLARLTKRLSVFSSGKYSKYSKLDELEVSGEVLQGGRPDLDVWHVDAGVSYQLNRRTSLRWSLRHEDADYGEPDRFSLRPRFDRQTDTTRLSLVRIVSRRDVAQAQLSYTENTLERPFFSDLEQDLVSGTLAWTRNWTSNFSSVITGGYTQVTTKQDFVPDDKQDTFVGGMTLEYSTRRSEMTASYSRTVRPASGTRSDQLVESVRGSYSHKLTERLEGSLGASWVRFREERFAGLVESDVRNITIDSDLSWRVGKRLVTFLSVSYFDKGSYGSLSEREFDRVRAGVGFRYAFEQEL